MPSDNFSGTIDFNRDEEAPRRGRGRPKGTRNMTAEEKRLAGFVVIPEDLDVIDRMQEQGGWDKQTYARMMYMKRKIKHRRWGQKTARQQIFGYRRGRLDRDDQECVKFREVLDAMFKLY